LSKIWSHVLAYLSWPVSRFAKTAGGVKRSYTTNVTQFKFSEAPPLMGR